MDDAASHGGSGRDFLAQHFPDAPKPWIDLSTGVNPWPYPIGDIPIEAWSELPSSSREASCRIAAANYLGTSPDNVALFPGTQAIISLMPRLFERGSVAIVEPTYNEHRKSWRQAGHNTVLADDVESGDADVLLVTNPNNPDGRVWAANELLQIARERTQAGKWLVIDEAFADMMPNNSLAGKINDLNLVVLRSFGKFFGLAGLRLGIAVAPPEFVQKLQGLLGLWSVSGPALEIGRRAYIDTVWQEQTRSRLAQASTDLHSALRDIRLSVVGKTDLFQLVQDDRADDLFVHLARNGIYIRQFRRNPRWLRFGIPRTEDLQRLSAALLTRSDS
jgi:cobalamin biosynthetic protein CobC